ncbi:MAG: DUF2802 domain-containing protein [Gammaproteobacteria bacterium]|nr:DUF2802 domain-containing protein [Gammaproteobacteria bacterium]
MDALIKLQPYLGTVLLTVLFLFLVLVIFVIRLQRSKCRMQEELHQLKSDMRAIVSAAVGVGERVHLLEKSFKQLSQRQEQQLDQADPEGQTFQQAIKMAQKGSSVDELIDICGLTRGEAELVSMLHRMERSF